MIGQTISHYRILEKLGEGGMGVVYKADDTKLRRPVALKFLAPELTRDEEAKRRFTREAQAASALDHPNIAVVHEIDETDDGRSYICMAYYSGATLKEMIGKGPVQVKAAVEIALQIADGLQRAHEAGIVHRDIKPANVIVTDRREVKIVDFGIAKLATGALTTTTGPTVGTAAYMSPEQAQGMMTDRRSDLFSLGIVLYEMLTGRRPFNGDHEAAVLYSIVSIDPVPPSSINPSIPPLLDVLVLRLLEKDPAKRYQSAGDLEQDLREVLDPTGPVSPIARRHDRFRFLTSRKFVALVGSVFLFLLVLFTLPKLWTVVKRVSLPSERSLAVLPFTNIGGDDQADALCQGLFEILSSTLTQLEPKHTWVIAASEIRQKQITSATEAHAMFGVSMAITGSVHVETERFRLTLNLVEAKSARQLRSVVIDQQRSNLLRLQDDVIVTLAGMLELDVPESRLMTLGKTDDVQAYELYVQGRGYLQRFERVENIVRAIELFSTATARDSNYALAWAGLGEAHWRRYEATKDIQWVAKAEEACQRALALNQQLAAVHVSLGIIYRGTGKYEEAIREFQNAVEIDRFSTDAYRELAAAYAALNDPRKAEGTYLRAIELRPGYWAGYNMLGVFYYRQGKFTEAERMFKKVIELSPENITGHNNLGGIYFYQEKWKEAREQFERSVHVHPTYIVYSQLGTLYFYERRFADAVKSYEKALQMQGTDYRVWGYLASAYQWAGQHEEAVATYTTAAAMAEEQRKVNPRDATVCASLAGYYAALSKPDEARRLAQEALAHAPTDLRLIGRVGMVYERLGDRAEALRLIEQAMKGGALPPAELERDPEMKSLKEDPRYQRISQPK